MGICHPEKTNVDQVKAEVDIGFLRGDNFPFGFNTIQVK